jgi:hypothetical protein
MLESVDCAKDDGREQQPLDRVHYVYALLDHRVSGFFQYNDLEYIFEHPPIYVGKGVRERCLGHFSIRKLEKDSNRLKSNKILKIKEITGSWPFVVKLRDNMTVQDSFDFEVFCIKQIGRIDLKTGPLTNLTAGGEGVCAYKRTEEDIRKQAESLKMGGKVRGENNPMYGVHRLGMASPHYGRHHSTETKDRLSKNHKGKKMSKEFCAQAAIRMRGEGNPNYNNGDKIKGSKNYQWITLTEKQTNDIVYMYSIEKLNASLISSFLGISEHIIRRTLIERNVELRSYGKNQKYIYNEELDLLSKIDEDSVLPKGFVFGARPVSEETRRKLSEINKGKVISEEQKEKFRKSIVGKYVGKNNKLYGKSKFIYEAITPNGIIHENIANIKEFCYKHDLKPVSVFASIYNKRPHKNWKFSRVTKNVVI